MEIRRECGALAEMLQSRAWYFWILVSAPALIQLLHFLSPALPDWRGQTLSIWFGLMATTVALGLWVVYRNYVRWPVVPQVAVAALGAAWLIRNVALFLEGAATNYTAYIAPLAILLVSLRPPPLRDAHTGALAFGYSVVIAGWAAILATLTGIVAVDPNRVSDGMSRIPFISSLIGLDTRWSGPFIHSNLAGVLLASVVVIGVTARGWSRIVLLVGSVTLLALTQSRTGALALVLGLLCLVLTSRTVATRSDATRVRIAMVGITGAAIAAYLALIDPTLGGRTDAWGQYWGLWRSSPVTGVGENGITAFVADWIPTSGAVVHHSHAHNLILDALTRHGVLLATAICVILVLAGWSSIRALRHGERLSLALVVSTFVAGLIETPIYWTYWETLMMPLALAVVLAGGATARDVDRGRPAAPLESPLSG